MKPAGRIRHNMPPKLARPARELSPFSGDRGKRNRVCSVLMMHRENGPRIGREPPRAGGMQPYRVPNGFGDGFVVRCCRRGVVVLVAGGTG
jgi:hypothetical protein